MSAPAHFRAFERRDVSLPVTITTDTEPPRPARLLNIGLGGACVEYPIRLRVGDPVQLELVTPTLWDPLILSGRITWVRLTDQGSCRNGVEFDHGRANVVRALLELLGAEGFE